MKTLYPLIFTPLFKYRMWGGEKLKSALNKEYSEKNIGESWEISDVTESETVVASGALKGKTIRELISLYGAEFVGESVLERFGEEFPLLIKFIDAKTPLSIQVHPSDELARERHNSFGKNEMWYVMQADEGAELIVGFDKKVSKEIYKKSLEEGTILDVLHSEKVVSGDVFNIPTGRVHAIGAGVLLAEIQQTSDVTYRIYDYKRVDAKTGKERELHTELAIDAIDFSVEENYKTAYQLTENQSNTLVHTPYFKTNVIALEGSIRKDASNIDSFIIYMCVEGVSSFAYENETYELTKGSTILIPAAINYFEISGGGKLLEVTI